MIAALFSVLLLAAETPATTAEAASVPAQEAAPAIEPTKTVVKEKKICRVDPANTGTRMKKKLCLTQNEWDMKAKGRNAADLKTLGAR
jgi:hypothetical protein